MFQTKVKAEESLSFKNRRALCLVPYNKETKTTTTKINK